MQGIDISSWNKGIDLSKIKADFVIVKATQGKSYVNPTFKTMISQTLDLKKCAGIYHYINGAGVEDEAQNFYKAVKPYLGKVTLWLDWESIQNDKWGDLAYLESLIKRVKELVGQPVGVYASYSVFPFTLCKKYDCLTWVAQYANDNVTGYQTSPWNEGKYKCDIRQYTEQGQLTGWSGRLDLNKAYMTSAQWAKFCAPEKVESVVKPVTTTQTETTFTPPTKGKYKITTEKGVNIRRQPSTSGTIVGGYSRGESVYIDSIVKAQGYYWGQYTGRSGKQCYIALCTTSGQWFAKRV